MAPEEFAAHILPDAPFYCMAVLGERGMRHFFYTTREELVNNSLAQDVAGGRGDVYYAFAGFRSHRRKRSEVVAVKTYVLDVDVDPSGVKHGRPCYTDAVSAATALMQHAQDGRLPRPTIIVQSGTGLHVYWVLEQQVTPDEWVPVANGLKRLVGAVDRKLAVDTTRVADIAGVLRLPGTTHRKTGNKVVALPVGRMLTQEAMRSFVEKAVGTLPEVQHYTPLNSMPKWVRDIQVPSPKLPATELLKCAQFADAVNNQATEGYEAWYATLQLCQFTEEGEALAHVASYQHPDYTKENTRRVYESAVRYHEEMGCGPITCEKYASRRRRPDLCHTCQLKKFGNTPITAVANYIGNEEAAAASDAATPAPQEVQEVQTTPPPEPVQQQNVPSVPELKRLDEERDGEEIVDVDALMKQYTLESQTGFFTYDHRSGATYFTQANSKDKATGVKVIQGTLRVSGVVDTHRGTMVQLDVIRGTEAPRVVGSVLVSAADMGTASRHHIVYAALGEVRPPSSGPAVSEFLTALANIAGKVDRGHVHSRFGWTKKGFIVGEDCINSKGTRKVELAGDAARIAPQLKTVGSADKAVEALRTYMQLLVNDARLPLLASLGSILPGLTDDRKAAAVHLYGGSGVGKTALMHVASSFWGPGEGLRMNPMDTENARYIILSTLHNLPTIIDEMTVATGTSSRGRFDLGRFIFTVVNGVGRNIANRTGSLGTGMDRTWRNITLTTANNRISDAVAAAADGDVASAQFLRVIELEFHDKTIIGDGMAEYRELMANAGWIGRIFARTIAGKRKHFGRRLLDLADEMDEKHGSEYRFVHTTLAACIIASEVLEETMGVKSLDQSMIEALGNRLRQQVIERQKVENTRTDPKMAVSRIVSELNSSMALFEKADDPMATDAFGGEAYRISSSSTPKCRVVTRPGAKAIISVDMDWANEISKRKVGMNFDAVLSEAGVPYEMRQVKLAVGVPDVRGTPQMDALPTPCFVFEWEL